MVIDTSALAAVLLGETDAEEIMLAIEGAPIRLMSAVTRVELSFVIEGKKGDAGRIDLERFLERGHIEVVSVTAQHAHLAVDAFRRFGKGRHRAGLNIGDCFSYALAAATGHPLLFKGHDFLQTDVRVALEQKC